MRSVPKRFLQPALRKAAVALCVPLLLASASPASAQAPAAEAPGAAPVRAGVEAWLKGRYKVDELRRTPVPGIWEVRIGKDLIYVDDKGQHAFVEGSLVDMRSNRNLTRERTDELLTIDFSTLPLNIAIKQVIGSGKRVLAVFEDPNCGYCKRMRADLLKLDDLTIYTFPMAFLAADSGSKARKALCSADQVRAWNELLLNNRIPGNTGTCDTSLEQVAELAKKLGITGTPVVFFSNGKRLQGYATPDRFNKMLADNSKS
jgi:thiol:disulfide interchange protein DsbC